MIWMESSSSKSCQCVVRSSCGTRDAAILAGIADGDPFNVELEAEAFPEQGAILRQVFENTCADIPHSRESDGEMLHAKGRGLSPPIFAV